MRKVLPAYLRLIFWDANLKDIDENVHKKYIIERILELGDKKAVSWLFKKYDKEDIQRVLKASRSISKKSKNFWNAILNDTL